MMVLAVPGLLFRIRDSPQYVTVTYQYHRGRVVTKITIYPQYYVPDSGAYTNKTNRPISAIHDPASLSRD